MLKAPGVRRGLPERAEVVSGEPPARRGTRGLQGQRVMQGSACTLHQLARLPGMDGKQSGEAGRAEQ
jgi:hypothetical protein